MHLYMQNKILKLALKKHETYICLERCYSCDHAKQICKWYKSFALLITVITINAVHISISEDHIVFD